jgi:LacI family transcriptional regulator
MNNPTLKKIAEMLGISISTVSRALKSHPDISETTRKKVADLAQMLDYEPNANAVHLRTKNSKLFGLSVPTVSNYFYESFISSIEEEGRKNGFSVMILQNGNDASIENLNLKLFRQNRITGLFACITPQTKDLHHFLKMKELEIPVIFFDKVPEETGLHKVCLADEQAGRIAAEAILRKKKKNILGIFGDSGLSITQKRQASFTQAILDWDEKIKFDIHYAASSGDAKKIIQKEFSNAQKPDTIFCMSDEILIGVMKAIQELEIKLGDSLSVISISNGFIPKLFYPEITYVETSGEKLGKLAFMQMMALLGGSKVLEDLTVEAVLIPGGTL